MAAQGLTTVRSSYEPKDTMDRLEAGVKAKGMTVFARIDHAAGASAVGRCGRLKSSSLAMPGAARR
jgi:uncharacterized protein (DUF302 family)